jgi:hypothetical protein
MRNHRHPTYRLVIPFSHTEKSHFGDVPMGPVPPARRSTKAPRGERGRAKMQQHQASAITRRDPRPNHCGFLACALLRCFSRHMCTVRVGSIHNSSSVTIHAQQSAISDQQSDALISTFARGSPLPALRTWPRGSDPQPRSLSCHKWPLWKDRANDGSRCATLLGKSRQIRII